MTRVVIDTNVLVSALLKPDRAEASVLFRVADRKLTWCVSPPILTEYETVLHRPKFSRLPESYIKRLLELAATSYLVKPAFRLSASPHEPDNRFLECAEEAAAAFLVTGNKRHFPAQWRSTRIVNAREMLGLIAHP